VLWNGSLADARLFLAILDSLSVVIVYLLGRRLLGQSTGLLAGILSALYFPFLFSTGVLTPDTLSVLLILLLVYSLPRHGEPFSPRQALLTGALLGVVLFTKPAFQGLLLFFPAAMGLYLYFGRSTSYRRTLAIAVLPLLLLVLANTFLNYWLLGEVAPLTPNRDHYLLYLHNLPSTLGWGVPTEDAVYQELHREGSLLAWIRGFASVVKEDPGGWVALVLTKAYRLLAVPYNDLGREPPFLPLSLQFLAHRGLLILALLGIAILGRRQSVLLIVLLVVPLYVTLLYALTHEETRYNLPVMPFAFLLASYAMTHFAPALPRLVKGPRGALLIAIAGAAFLTSAWVEVPLILEMLPWKNPSGAFAVELVMDNLALVALGLILWHLLRFIGAQKREGLTFLGLGGLALLIVNGAWATDPNWREWQARIGPEESFRQEFVLPQETRNLEQAFVLLDAAGEFYGRWLRIDWNGQRVAQFQSALPLDYVPAWHLDFFRQSHSNFNELRAWRKVPLPTPMLRWKETNVLTLTLHDMNKEGHDQSKFRVYGAYGMEDRIWEGPSLTYNSVNKYIYDRDARVSTRMTLASVASRSSLLTSQRWSSGDLSSEAGLQIGEYRLRLLVIDANGGTLFY